MATSAALHKVVKPLQDLKNPSLFTVEEDVILWKQLPSSSARTRLKFLGSTIAMFDLCRLLNPGRMFYQIVSVYI